MVERVGLDADCMASIKCPECEKLFRKDLSRLKNAKNAVKLKCKCLCGHIFSVIVDRRRHTRKKTQLTGAFIHDKKRTRGLISIRDLSRSGIGFELESHNPIATGDVLTLRFTLDDAFETVISKEVLARRVKGKYVGNEFLDILYEHDLLHLYMRDYLPS